jgi:hypothetical protein
MPDLPVSDSGRGTTTIVGQVCPTYLRRTCAGTLPGIACEMPRAGTAGERGGGGGRGVGPFRGGRKLLWRQGSRALPRAAGDEWRGLWLWLSRLYGYSDLHAGQFRESREKLPDPVTAENRKPHGRFGLRIHVRGRIWQMCQKTTLGRWLAWHAPWGGSDVGPGEVEPGRAVRCGRPRAVLQDWSRVCGVLGETWLLRPGAPGLRGPRHPPPRPGLRRPRGALRPGAAGEAVSVYRRREHRGRHRAGADWAGWP